MVPGEIPVTECPLARHETPSPTSVPPVAPRDYLRDAPHSIYVLWSDDRAVYVGCTSNWEQRMAAHGGKWRKHDVTHADVWETGLPRREALDLELATIHALQPTLNISGSGRVVRRRTLTYWENQRAIATIREVLAESPHIKDEDPDLWAAMRRAVSGVA